MQYKTLLPYMDAISGQDFLPEGFIITLDHYDSYHHKLVVSTENGKRYFMSVEFLNNFTEPIK